MAVIAVRCPSCKRDNVVKRGSTNNDKQRYLCQYEACSRRTFLLDYTNRGYLPSVKRQIIELALNGSGNTRHGSGVRHQHRYGPQ